MQYRRLTSGRFSRPVLAMFRPRAARHRLRSSHLAGMSRASTSARAMHLRTRHLEARIARLDCYARCVAHDLRGPVGGMAGLCELAMQALRQGDAGKAAHLLGAVCQHGGKLLGTIDDLMVLARAGTPGRRPALNEVDLAHCVQEAAELVQLSQGTGERTRDLELTLHALPQVAGHRGLLRQLFVNLIGNAVKFARHTDTPHIQIGCVQRPDGAVIFVRDNGVGFDPQEHPRLFEPFVRGRDTGVAGHGLGLDIVRRIVEHHGGRVWADSRPDAGTTIYFTLQAAPD